MSHNHTQNITQGNEKKTLFVIILTIITMAAEIFFGYFTHSMALLADGFHMSTHALALSLTYIAYILIRKFDTSPLFPKGTAKIGTLSAYTSSLFLGVTGVWIIIEAFFRLIHPLNIKFEEAIFVAILGLLVNGVCIFIMDYGHNHCSHTDGHNCEDKDYNFKAAYYHILADALTSILAILALVIGKFFHFVYLDSLVGVLGGVLILRWAFGLIRDTVKTLIDMKR